MYRKEGQTAIDIRFGSFEARAATGNLNPDEIKQLWVELQEHKRAGSKMFAILRLIAGSGSQWKDKVQKVLDEIEFGTDDPAIIAAAKKALSRKKLFN